MKKLISLIIAVLILIGTAAVMPLSVFAQEDEPAPTLKVPQIRVVTEGGNGTSLQKADGYVNAAITITDIDGSTLSDSVQFKVRGNTTAMLSVNKKAFTFKFAKKKNVLGMGSGKKWALLANYFDPTLLRNYIAIELAHHLELPYTSEQRYVEMWVDDSYRGLYTLMEPVQEGKDRVNIDIESNEGKKDFMIEYERLLNEADVTYLTVEGLRFAVKEPEEPTADQLAYIQGIMDDTVSCIKNGTKDEISSKIDVSSFAKYYLLNEFYKTYDFDTSSVFYYYQDGRLCAGPPWDYDLSTGNTTVEQARGKAAHEPEDIFAEKQLFSLLCKHAWFRNEVRKVFCENYLYLKNIAAPDGMIDTLYAEYGDLYLRNFADKVLCPRNGGINIQQRPFLTYQENLDYLRDWLSRRHEWLSSYYGVVFFGDADNDGKISILDATKIQRVLASLDNDADGSIARRCAAREGALDILDATAVQRWLASYTVDVPIGQYTCPAESEVTEQTN